MHENSLVPENSRFDWPVKIRQAGLILLLVVAGLAPTGCGSFNSHMDAPPNSGVPPYSDDPESSGNPARAWYD